MRKPWHPAFEWLYVTAALVAFVVALPVALPVALVQQGRVERRRKRRAQTAPCERCGIRLGEAALAQADEAWREHVRRLHDRHPGCRFRLVRRVWAMCVACGQAHDYDEKADRFFIGIERYEGESQEQWQFQGRGATSSIGSASNHAWERPPDGG